VKATDASPVSVDLSSATLVNEPSSPSCSPENPPPHALTASRTDVRARSAPSPSYLGGHAAGVRRRGAGCDAGESVEHRFAPGVRRRDLGAVRDAALDRSHLVPGHLAWLRPVVAATRDEARDSTLTAAVTHSRTPDDLSMGGL
jgi:hypothetical protein